MKCCVFHLKPGVDLEVALEELEQIGRIVLTQEETTRSLEIWVEIHQLEMIESVETVDFVKTVVLDEVDWEEQWKNHAFDFRDGFLHFNVEGIPLKLFPGPGFGDLSHPTTRLMVQEMATFVPNRIVFDVGCGSGVLAVAAAALKASHVFAIDIDLEALEHTKKNSELNGFSEIITVCNALPEKKNAIALMNMISSEQLQAWPEGVGELLTSGILKEEEEEYTSWAASKGFSTTLLGEDEGWCVFHLFNKSSNDSPL